MSQNERVLAYMRTHGGITAMDAFSQLHITRLSARIFDLRERGHKIVSDRIKKKNEDGTHIHYERFRVIENG